MPDLGEIARRAGVTEDQARAVLAAEAALREPVRVPDAAALAARRRGFRLGDQLGFTVAAALVPVIVWTLLWVLGLWPGHFDRRFGYWVDGSERARAAWGMVIAGAGAAAMAYPALQLRGAPAWGLWLGALQALVALLIGLTVLTWRRLSPPAGIRSSS